jgi:DNA polymerase-1
MIRFPGNGILIETLEELAQCPRTGKLLFMDFETKSGHKDKDSLNPWHNCFPIGIAYSWDNDPNKYFIPWHLIKLDTTGFLHSLMRSAVCWINHNVKYDAHVLLNSTGWELPENLHLVCTLMLAHIIDADRSYKGGYGLDALSKHWCGLDIDHYYNRIEPYLFRNGKRYNHDYGQIPLDILAEYACGDIEANRRLYHVCMASLPPESCEQIDSQPALVNTEIKLTRVLLEVERNGLTIVPSEVLAAEYLCRRRMLDIEEKLNRILGYYINPGSTDQLFDLICNRFGQPVLSWTNVDREGRPTLKSNPSFGKKVLKAYLIRLDLPQQLRECVKLILEYRKESQELSLFYVPWQLLNVKGVLHGWYVQNVRSGRMACKQPNEQQFNKRAKKLIKPKPGYVMLAHDYSQVEYRVIVHYTNNRQAVEAYANDPDTDYHVWVSILCKIDRQPAKTMNFLMAFGGGKAKAIATLAANFHEQGLGLSNRQLQQLGEQIYNAYHANLPELKTTSNRAAAGAQARGYVVNLAGRRLHLPGPHHNIQYSKDGKQVNRCHIAFNRAVQSSASDFAKERAVAIVSEPWFKEYGIQLIGLVHDAFYFQMPDRPDSEVIAINNRIRAYLEDTPYPLRVCLRVDSGFSRRNMADTDAAPYCALGVDRAYSRGGKHWRDNDGHEQA